MRNKQIGVSLMDVMYGVIFAYGFNYFDLASGSAEYMRFILAYLLLIADWYYYHSYWDQKHNKWLFISDLSIIFIFSRLLSSSVHPGGQFYLWLAVLFAAYFVWDSLIYKFRSAISYDIKISMAGNVFMLLIYLGIGASIVMGRVPASNLAINLIALATFPIYLMTFTVNTPRFIHKIN